MAASLSNPLIHLGYTPDHALDLIRVCSDQKLRGELLTRKINNTTQKVVLVGEVHQLDEKTLSIGRRLLDRYPKIGVETAGNGLFIMHSKLWNRFITIGQGGNSLCNPFLYSNTKPFDLESGFYLTYSRAEAFSGPMAVLGAAISAITPRSFRYSKQLDGCAVAICLTYLAIYYMTTWSCKADDRFDRELRFRDRLIAQNISFAAKTSNTEHLVAIMGRGHLFGVKKQLIKDGFIDQSASLSQQYDTFKATQPDALAGTIPVQSYIAPGLQYTYPEEFCDRRRR